MRKVLLATTAIVALGGVTAASADISVSGGAEFKYQSWGGENSSARNTSAISNETKFKISASTVADNGMTLSAYTMQDGTTSGNFNDFGFSISDDWGTLGFEDAESGDAFETSTAITAEEAYDGGNKTVTYRPTESQIAPTDVSYLSPNMSGFQFSVGYTDTTKAEDTTAMGAQYAMSAGDAAITVKYAVSSTGSTTTTGSDGTDHTSMGLVVGMSGVTLTLAANTSEVTNASGVVTADVEANSMALAYTVSDAMSVQVYTGESDDSKNANFEFKDTGYGLSYTITPGLAATLTHNSWDYKTTASDGDSGTNTAFALNLSF